MKKLMQGKKGFTLVEMLIVVAIIAILVAIAIPVYQANLKAAEEAVEQANIRSAQSMAVVEFLTTKPVPTSLMYYAFAVDDTTHALNLINPGGSSSAISVGGDVTVGSSTVKAEIVVKVEDGAIVE